MLRRCQSWRISWIKPTTMAENVCKAEINPLWHWVRGKQTYWSHITFTNTIQHTGGRERRQRLCSNICPNRGFCKVIQWDDMQNRSTERYNDYATVNWQWAVRFNCHFNDNNGARLIPSFHTSRKTNYSWSVQGPLLPSRYSCYSYWACCLFIPGLFYKGKLIMKD
jgi:hypothetical protein